jgi:hypothetical protein
MRIQTVSKLAALLTIFAIGTVQAAPKEAPKGDAKSEAKGKAKTKRDTYPLWGEVVSVTPKLLTIKGGEGKENRKYAITADTKIHNDDKPATIADIKTGKMVGGLIKKVEGAGDDQMVSINTGVKQERSKGDAKAGTDAKAGEEPKSKGKKKAE